MTVNIVFYFRSFYDKYMAKTISSSLKFLAMLKLKRNNRESRDTYIIGYIGSRCQITISKADIINNIALEIGISIVIMGWLLKNWRF